jgi:hypothetical protein
VVTLLLDRGADIHAIHGAGVGSFEGYGPQDKQPIDLAIWGGPRQVPLARWRCYANGLAWLLWRRWRPWRPVWPGRGNVPLARLLIRRGATYDLTVAAALNDLAACPRRDAPPRALRQVRSQRHESAREDAARARYRRHRRLAAAVHH